MTAIPIIIYSLVRVGAWFAGAVLGAVAADNVIRRVVES